MKQGKKLQRWMKDLLKKNNIKAENWLYIKNEPGRLTIMHKHSLELKKIYY